MDPLDGRPMMASVIAHFSEIERTGLDDEHHLPHPRQITRLRVGIASMSALAAALVAWWVLASGTLFVLVPQIPRFRCAPAVGGERRAVEVTIGAALAPEDVRTRTVDGRLFAVARVDDVVGVFEVQGPVGDPVAVPADNTAEHLSGSSRSGPLPAAEPSVASVSRACLAG